MAVPLLPPTDLADLRSFSARAGADPLLIQAAGGNTSVKEGDVMWIKASGTLLEDALKKDIFVEVDLPPLNDAIESADARADSPAEFARIPGGLRPSIETSLHSIFPLRVVVHVHCVNTIALAIRKDARERLAERLRPFDWAFVPYAKPGAKLAIATMAARRPTTDVVVLGNHGLIVSAASVTQAEALLDLVVSALRVPAAPNPSPDMDKLLAVAGGHYKPAPPEHSLHGVALSPARLAMATKGSLYPDHVIFCGVGATALKDESADRLAARLSAAGVGAPPFLLVAGAGALLHAEASASALALSRCLGDVLARTPEDARLNYLTDIENRELIDWDAEKYRQALNAG